MGRLKDEVFKKVLKCAETPATPRDFTATVMQEIIAEQQETVINPALGKLIQQYGIEKAPADFSRAVMVQLNEVENQKVYKPVISRKTGYAIAAIIIIIVFLSSLSGEQHSTSTYSHNYYIVISSLNSISSVYLITLLISAALLIGDFLFAQPQRLKTTSPGKQ